MKLLCNLLVALLVGCFFVSSGFASQAKTDIIARKLAIDIPIRVLLDEQSASKSFQWRLESPSAFFLFFPDNKRSKVAIQAPVIIISYQKGAFYVNGKRQSTAHFFIVPLKESISFKGNAFYGVFAVTYTNGVCSLVNHVDIEEYVLSVVPYESLQGWPPEVQKAFCISFRSYGISKVLERRTLQEKGGKVFPYDIKNTNAHQVYRGNLKSLHFKKFVEDTRGVVLVHDKKPVLAMFDICCGGVIPAYKQGVNFGKAPYLKRSYSCKFCKNYRFYAWKYQYPFDRVEKELKKEFPTFGTLRDIKVSSYDQAGVALEIKCRSANRWYTLSAAKFKSFFKELRSLCFVFKRSSRTLVIEGKGYGHLIGLCQRGALEMVSRGWNCKDILKFYYPQTSFMRLKKKEGL